MADISFAWRRVLISAGTAMEARTPTIAMAVSTSMRVTPRQVRHTRSIRYSCGTGDNVVAFSSESLAALVLALLFPVAAQAASYSQPFRLAAGQAARPAFYFVVTAPGTIGVQVETPLAEPVVVTVYAGAAVAHRAMGQATVAFDVTATAAHVAAAREWAIVVSGATPDTVGEGRIRVTAPDDRSADTDRLDTWMKHHPAVAFHTTWNDGARSAPYSAWPAAMRAALRVAFEDAVAGRDAALPDPLPNDWTTRPGDDPQAIHTAFVPAAAQQLYLATVAHAIALETERRVPWSLDDLNGDALDALLASTSLFWWNPEQQAYEISEFDHGWAVPAAPQVAWSFLQRGGLLKATRLDTVTALVGWASSLTHFAGPVSRENFRDHWGYEGDMPVSRALAGTRYRGVAFASMPGYDRVRHYTAGCQGTAGLFASVLRAANIPARPRSVSNDSSPHATVLFLSEDRALSHADDPYSLLAEGAPPQDLLIDLATYNRWLGPGSKDAGRFIGRQAHAVGLARLPGIVRRTHERDRQQGLSPAQSGVFSLFKSSYFMAELEEARLWERLDEAGGTRRDAPSPGASGAGDIWLDAEALATTVTAGTAEPQPLDAALLGMWRNQQQLQWRDARPGAELVLPFEVPEAGTYRISVRFTRAPNYASVAIRLDDRTAVLDRVSLYAPRMLAADPLSMGEHALGAGSHRLRFAITGAHPLAVPDYVVGIDAIRLERLR
jgi:hypothetical protein